MSSTNRRSFLTKIAAGAETSALSTIKVCKHEVTRLIAGYNPIGGYSHSVPKLTALMKDWFTLERTIEYVHRCERQGIDKKVFAALRAAWDQGSKMKWMCLMSEADPAQWKEIVDLKPIAVVHHGGVTHRVFRSGEDGKIRDFLKKAHDFGVLAGVSSHRPMNIARVEDSNWEQDFYMTCFHEVTLDEEKVKAGLGDLPIDELYLRGDPQRMAAVIRKVSRPCVAFKILAAGRACNNRASIEKAFQFAYANIKKTDAVIVGMFPILTDEIAEDAALARKYS